MTQQNPLSRTQRFGSATVSDIRAANRTPISGYQDAPSGPLEAAVESIVSFVPRVQEYATTAIEKRRRNTHLTRDESAAIYLYTMMNDFYTCLNDALRFENREALKPWFAFLKLFLSALEKLPSCRTILWRGVGDNYGSHFDEGYEHTWWSVNSCSPHQNVARCYADPKGTLFCIHVIHGKDITTYSANQVEEEIILMPGTRLRVKSAWSLPEGLSTVVLEECTAIPPGQHVMLSYHSKSQDVVNKIHDILQSEQIRVWMDQRGDMKENNMYDSLADGVENAAIICCFLTSDYEASEICKLELKYAHKRHKTIIPCVLSDAQLCNTSAWLKPIIDNLKCIDISGLNLESKAKELVDRINCQSPVSTHQGSQPVARPSYLFEMIRFEYIRNSRIERFMNPAISYSIEQSYINLAIVDTKEHQEKEKQLQGTQSIDGAMGAFEGIYGTKTPIDIKDIFKAREREARQVLVFGRAGIGKSTFCRYAAYQWAAGTIWPEYDLVVLIPLRSITEQDYPAAIDHALVDIVRKQNFSDLRLSDQDKQLLEEQFRKSRILWLLDGYDELVQNKSSHLERLITNLLQTPDHILTSRPYMTSLSYSVQMEITGFTDTDIPNYIKQFFDQLENEPHYSSTKHDRLLSFLRLNPRIWGIAHIPINLELICSVWSNTMWSTPTKTMTMTMLYNELTEWICRRYWEKQSGEPIYEINLLDSADIGECCRNELLFLECLAFHGMGKGAILLGSDLLKKAKEESKCSFIKYPNLLNIGILKSSAQHGIGTRIEAEKDHYFVHLSFQEYFAARYLINALRGANYQKAIEFIQHQKYNQWFQLVILYIFAFGLLSESGDNERINIFWNNLLAEPLDLVGIRHIQLTISCLDEEGSNQSFPHRPGLLNSITRWIKAAFTEKQVFLRDTLQRTLRSCSAIKNEPTLQIVLAELLRQEAPARISAVLSFISFTQITAPHPSLLDSISRHMEHTDSTVRREAFHALGEMGEKVATSGVISELVRALGDEDSLIRSSACLALVKLGEKAVRSEVISRLVNALGDEHSLVRSSACYALGGMGEKAATSGVISRLVNALGDENSLVRSSACAALGKMGEKATTSEVISRLVCALGDKNFNVRSSACEALGKMGERAATSEVISRLVTALGDKDFKVRSTACDALGMMGEKAATSDVISALVSALGDEQSDLRITAVHALVKMGDKAVASEVISRLVTALGDQDFKVRSSACDALGNMGEKAATSDVISGLVSTLGDQHSDVRSSAGYALSKVGEKAATNEVISGLVTALGDEHFGVRSSACDAFEKMGEKAATNEVITGLVSALGDENSLVKRRACDALGKMGEKAVRSEVISRLVSTLGDQHSDVRSSACDALGNMGENAATSGVIRGLVNALGDEESGVRRSACDALVKVGVKAATSEVISRLVTALGDEHFGVRSSACHAFGKMSDKAATNEVISGLVSALGDEHFGVRRNACYALGKMGEKAATSGVISRLVTALGDENSLVRSSACAALGKMSDKAATNEVISGLVSALGDEHFGVRRNACYALGKMGEKAATSGVISRLVTALGDENSLVRSSACAALGKMSDKAATNEVISGLVSALGDKDSNVKRSACYALGKIGHKATKSEVNSGLVSVVGYRSADLRIRVVPALGNMGEEAATRDVISGLVTALGDKDFKVRSSTGYTRAKMGDKVVPSEVISRTVTAFGDKDFFFKSSTCGALVKAGVKAATNEVISRLVNALGDKDCDVKSSAYNALVKIGEKASRNEFMSGLVSAPRQACDGWQRFQNEDPFVFSSLLSAFAVFQDKGVAAAEAVATADRCFQTRSISIARLVKVFLDRGEPMWLPVIVRASLFSGSAITAVGNTVCVYERQQVVKIPVTDQVFLMKFREEFENYSREVGLKVVKAGSTGQKRKLDDAYDSVRGSWVVLCEKRIFGLLYALLLVILLRACWYLCTSEV